MNSLTLKATKSWIDGKGVYFTTTNFDGCNLRLLLDTHGQKNANERPCFSIILFPGQENSSNGNNNNGRSRSRTRTKGNSALAQSSQANSLVPVPTNALSPFNPAAAASNNSENSNLDKNSANSEECSNKKSMVGRVESIRQFLLHGTSIKSQQMNAENEQQNVSNPPQCNCR